MKGKNMHRDRSEEKGIVVHIADAALVASAVSNWSVNSIRIICYYKVCFSLLHNYVGPRDMQRYTKAKQFQVQISNFFEYL